MGQMIQNISNTTQVFCVNNNRTLSMQSRNFGGTAEYVTDEEFEHPNVKMLIEKGVLRVVTEEKAVEINSSIEKKKEESEETLEFGKYVDSAKDVAIIDEQENKAEESNIETEKEFSNEEEYIEYRCSAKTASGNQCKRKVRLTKSEFDECGGNPLCGLHSK